MSMTKERGEGNLPPYTFSNRDVSLIPVHYQEDGAWRDEALCREKGNALFFAQIRRGESQVVIQQKVADAQKLCLRCPVRLNCLNYAIKSLMRHGVWGGVQFDNMSVAERNEVAKQLEGFNP
jgi:WhiB family redox-sensing transcriptional regulator